MVAYVSVRQDDATGDATAEDGTVNLMQKHRARAWRMLGVLAIVGWGCSRTGPEPRAEPVRAHEPTPRPLVGDASSVGASAVDAGPILAWTDEAAVAGLARACGFTPPPPTNPREGRAGPLSCALDFEQACVSDPCFHEDETTCKEQCVTTCDGCGASCVTSCESCKSSCKDDACRVKCAASCGRCRQECLTARDRCSTAQCAKVYDACRTKLVSTWLAKDCDAVCARTTKKCGFDSDCWEKSPAVAACRANVVLCPEMATAPERRTLDPKWKQNHCEDVCAKIWACAAATCAKKSGCGEPAKEFEGCSRRVAGTQVCGTVGIDGMMRCPEPQTE